MSELDGIKFTDGVVTCLLRISGTENAIRISAESKDKSRLDKVFNDIMKTVKRVINDR